MRWLAFAVLVLGCAPSVDGPVDRQRAVDRDDATRLHAQVLALPGVARAEVVLTRPARDPLATTSPTSPTTSLVIVVDDRADRAKIEASARTLARAITPAVDPTIVVEVGVHRPALATVGPFTVAQSSKGPLKAALAIALALIAALAGWIAWTYRRRA